MPIEICVKHNGKIYCWDVEDETINEITKKPIHISECPEIVVFDIMRQLNRKNRSSEEKI